MRLSIPCKLCGRRMVVDSLRTWYCPECKVLIASVQRRESSRRRYGSKDVYLNCKTRLLEKEVRV